MSNMRKTFSVPFSVSVLALPGVWRILSIPADTGDTTTAPTGSFESTRLDRGECSGVDNHNGGPMGSGVFRCVGYV